MIWGYQYFWKHPAGFWAFIKNKKRHIPPHEVSRSTLNTTHLSWRSKTTKKLPSIVVQEFLFIVIFFGISGHPVPCKGEFFSDVHLPEGIFERDPGEHQSHSSWNIFLGDSVNEKNCAASKKYVHLDSRK